MSLLGILKGKGPNGFGFLSTADEVLKEVELSDKIFLVTGVNSGLGLETARALTARGATIIGLARTEEKARHALTSIGADKGIAVACELSEPSSVRAAVEAVKGLNIEIDGLIANAGIMALPKLETKYGYELQFFTNHVGHFILVTGLLETLAEDGRVVMLSSVAHKQAYRAGIQLDNLDGARGYTSWGAYGQSKLANLLFAKELATRLGPKQSAYAVHPGVIPTNLVRHLPKFMQLATDWFKGLFMKTIPQGAATQVYVAAHPRLSGSNGDYFADCNVARTSKRGADADLARKLWEESERIVAAL
jgi:WW domain-containing oxidoreductase